MELDEIIKNFGNIYTSKIVPGLAVFENNRKKELKNYNRVKICFVIVIIIFVIIAILYFIFAATHELDSGSVHNTSEFIIGLMIIVIGLMASKMNSIDKNYRNQAKQELFPIILHPFGNFKILNTSYNPIDINEIKQAGLCKKAEDIDCDDIIQGNYKNNEIIIQETTLTHEERSGKSSYTVTDFQGIIIKTNLNRIYKGTKTFLRHKSSDSSKIANLQRIRLEDVELEKIYEIYADDQIESRCLLDLSFLEKFKKAKSLLKAKYIDFLIYKNTFYIFVGTNHDFFEICSVQENIYNVDVFRNAAQEFASIFKLIEHFELVNIKN